MIPLWLKLAYTVFVAIIVPVYAKKWGWGNFLWFSDIALLLMVPALWTESRLLVSMMAVGWCTFPGVFLECKLLCKVDNRQTHRRTD
jgi:hypothetical protein